MKEEGEDGVARGLAQAQVGKKVGVGPGKTLHPRRESTRLKRATRMRPRRPHRGYRRLWARGSGTWDKASRSVMPLVYLKGCIPVKSGWKVTKKRLSRASRSRGAVQASSPRRSSRRKALMSGVQRGLAPGGFPSSSPSIPLSSHRLRSRWRVVQSRPRRRAIREPSTLGGQKDGQ